MVNWRRNPPRMAAKPLHGREASRDMRPEILAKKPDVLLILVDNIRLFEAGDTLPTMVHDYSPRQ